MSGKDEKGKSSECVQVVVRLRPLSRDEVKDNRQIVVDMERQIGQVRVRKAGAGKSNTGAAADAEPPKTFTFDTVFAAGTEQKMIYEDTARSIVDSVLKGYNGTIFAYGQTGTGKTWTMDGGASENDKGVMPRTFDHIFSHISATANTEFLVRASFIEIYQDDVLDLLSDDPTPTNLDLKERDDKTVYIKDVTMAVVKSVPEINQLLAKGKLRRKVGETKMNDKSSRSHCIFTITVEQSNTGPDGQSQIRVGKLNLVDLAGSERQSKTGAEGMRLKEAAKINLALSALGNVISALTASKPAAHIPYRDSKLTRLLQDSLGGNTKTVMIANIGPADYNYDETISTLRFAHRAKSIKNQPKINENPKDAMLREFQEEILRLRAALAAAEAGDGGAALAALPPGAAAKLGLSGLAPLGGARGPPLAPKTVTVEKVVERIVTTGVSEERVRELEEQALKTKNELALKHAKEKEEIRAITAQLANRSDAMAKTNAALSQSVADKQKERLALRDKLKEVEAKITKGNQLISAAEKQKLQLAATKAEAHQRAIEAERQARELAERQEEQQTLTDKYESQEKEVAAKRKKLGKLQGKYAEIKQEIDDLQAEHQREREDLLEEIRNYTRHIQLMDVMLEHFVPKPEHDKVEKRARWDDDKNEFILTVDDYAHVLHTEQRPASCKPGARRPVTDFARARQLHGDRSARFRGENIIELDIDLPDRSTRDFAGPAPHLQHMHYMHQSMAAQQQQHHQQHQQQQAAAQQQQYLQQMAMQQHQYGGAAGAAGAQYGGAYYPAQPEYHDQLYGGAGDHQMMQAMAAAAAQGIDADIDDFPQPADPHGGAGAGGAVDDDYGRPRTARGNSRF